MSKCPRCPLCSGPPAAGFEILWPAQAFCDNPQCAAISWNPGRTLDENLLDANSVRLPDWLK